MVGRDQEVDVTDLGALERELAQAKPDAIVHLAAQSSVAVSVRDETLTVRVNFIGSRNPMEAAARRTPGARILLVSSGDV